MADSNSNFVNPYERIWKTRDLRELEPKPIELENNLSQFRRGLGAFGKEMQATGYGLAALGAQGLENVIGENKVTSGITDWGLKGYQQAIDESQSGYNAPNVADVSNIKGVGDFTDWAGYQLGKGLPMLGSLALSGGVGGAVARLGANAGIKQIAKSAVGDVVKKGVATKALQAAEGQIVTKAMQETAAKALRDSIAKGAMTGGFAGSFGLEGGLAFGEQVGEGVAPEDAVKSAIAVGGINGALEFLPFYGVAKSIGLGQYAKNSIKNIIKNDAALSKKAVALATAKELGGRAAKGGLVGAGTEGITEGLQELTSIAGLRWAKEDPLFAELSDDDWNRIGNAMAAGALVGGVAAGAGATLGGPQVQAQPSTTQPPAGTPPATTPSQTRAQALDSLRTRVDTELEAAQKRGDTKRVQELQEARDIIVANQERIVEEAPIQEAPVQEAPMQEPLVQEPPAPVVPAPGEPIQMQQGEEVILTPGAAPTTSVIPTTEETANAQEVQAQTEAEVKPGTPPLQSRALQRPESPAPFYSALERATQEAKQQKAPPAQWESTLDNMVKKGLVKQEELDWSGTKEWLKEQKEPVTKEALLQHIKENTLEVKETLLGAGAPRVTRNPDTNKWEVYDLDGNLVGTVDGARDDSDAEVSRFGNELADLARPFYGDREYLPNTINTKWTLPGGENQRELVLTVPSIEPFNTDDTTHYGDVGGGRAVAWVRFNDRVDGDGKKTLFVEEIQSKRHQEGKDIGYKPNAREIESLRKREDAVFAKIEKMDIFIYGTPEERFIIKRDYNKLPEDIKEELDGVISDRNYLKSEKLIPNAPFKQEIAGSGQTLSGWAGLAFKRMLRYAVENGYDKVAFTNGEQQVKRYQGKGEKFLKRLYDDTIPNELNKYVKKWGAKVDKTQMEFGDKSASVHSVEITPAMRESVMRGQPLFSKETGRQKIVTPEMDAEYLAAVERGDMEAAQRMVDEAAKNAGYTVGPLWHHGGFNKEEDAIPNIGADGMHFGTEQAARERAYGKLIDDFIKEGEVTFDDDLGAWFWSSQGVDSYDVIDEDGFSSRDKAQQSLENFANWRDPDEDANELGTFTKVFLKADNVIHITDQKNSWSKAIAKAKLQGLESISYTNLYEDKGSTSYIVFNPEQVKSADPITHDSTGTIIPLSQRFNITTPDIRYTQQPDTANIPLQDFYSNINSIMGEGWLQQATEAGLVEVIEGKGPNGEAGSWAGDRIRLYTGSMPKDGSPAGVLLHEGKHATFKDILGDSLSAYVKDLHTLAKNGNKVAQDAITHAVIAATDSMGIKHNLYDGGTKADFDGVRAIIEEKYPGLLAEEELAYFVQHGAEAQTGQGFLRRLINAIKAWLMQTRLGQRAKELGIGFELTDGMAVEWAKMGLNRSLQELKQAERAVTKAKEQPVSVRLGDALEGINEADPLYSMGIQELSQRLWTDPTDVNQELVNKPGLLQRFRGNFIDFFAEMEKKSKDIYDTYSLLRSKIAGRIEQARQEYYFPLRELIAKSPWSAKEMGDMLAARHIKVDKVNTRLAERASYGFTKDLLKALPKTKQKELMKGRVHIKAGKMPDGSDYIDANGNKAVMAATTKQKLMFDLMNKYVQHEITDANGRQVLREEWELFKDAAGGFSNGGVGKNKVRTVDDVLQMADRDRTKFDEIANLFDALNRHILDILEEGGLITAKEHARLLADKSAYAPLRRESYNVNREIELLFQKAGQGGSKQIATRTGTAALSEPALVLQNALAATEAAAAAAERNLANKDLYKVIVADREGWKPWFTIVEKDKYVTHDEDGFLQEKHATASNRADITLINDGKKLVIRPNMHNERAMGFVRAVNNLDAQILSGPMQVLGWVNQIVRWVNVSASPVFLMMNMVRDPFTALYNIQASKAGEYWKEIFSPKTYKDSFKALKKVFMDGNRDPNDPDVQLVEEWELAGGRTSFVETLREMDDTWRSFDAQVARRQGNMKQLMQAKDKWIDGIENLNILFENVMRFSTYKVLREHQVSKKEAARISQDLTTNFTRRGYKTQMLGTWWLFFNATVQGNYQVLRNLMGSKKVQAMVGGTIVLGLLLDLLGRAIDDDWDKIPEWDKERFIILPVKVGGDFVRIPAPWVYNVVWRTGGLLGEALSGVKKPQDAVLDIAAMTTTVFNPLGKPGSIAQAIAPTAADPFVQILENKDFAGNPLGPEGFPGAGSKANSELLWSSTPKAYQSIARWVNEFTGGSAVESGMIDLRPADYQLLARFLTGSLGRFMSDATFGVKEALDKGIEGPRDIPIVKEIFSDPYDPLKSQKYHTNIAGIYGAHKLEQMYLRGPDRDLIKLQEVRKNRGEELRMYSQAQDVERQLKSLRVRLRAAQNREDREREKEIKDRMGKIQERFNERYQQRMG